MATGIEADDDVEMFIRQSLYVLARLGSLLKINIQENFPELVKTAPNRTLNTVRRRAFFFCGGPLTDFTQSWHPTTFKIPAATGLAALGDPNAPIDFGPPVSSKKPPRQPPPPAVAETVRPVFVQHSSKLKALSPSRLVPSERHQKGQPVARRVRLPPPLPVPPRLPPRARSASSMVSRSSRRPCRPRRNKRPRPPTLSNTRRNAPPFLSATSTLTILLLITSSRKVCLFLSTSL